MQGSDSYASGNRGMVDVQSILQDLLKSWQNILLVGIAAAMLCYSAISIFHTSVYTVSTTFAVSESGANATVVSDISVTSEMTQKFSMILENNILKKKVAEDLGLENIDASMKAQVLPETNMMVLSVSAKSPEMAFKVLESVLRTYPEVSDFILPNVTLSTLKQPEISATPSNQLPVGRYMLLAFILAVIVVSSLIALTSYFRDTVKNEDEFAVKVDAPLLGTIYHEKKQKKDISMLITNPLMSFKYVESYRMLASRVKGRMDKQEAKILMVTSVTENEGKSTVAANLALALAQEQKRVLLMDCDFRKPALHKIFSEVIEIKTDLTNVLMGKETTEGMIKKIPNSHLFLSFSHKSITHFTELLSNGRMKTILNYCMGQMDYIILDTPPMGLVADTEDIAKLADAVVLVVRQDMVLAKDINDAIDILDQDQGKVLGCVYSNVQPRLSDHVSRSSYGYGSYDHYSKADR